MSLTSLATTASTSSTDSKIQAVYAYLDSTVLGNLVNSGNSTPDASKQSLPWIKTLENGTLDGVFLWHNDNWYTRMPTQVGTVSLFDATADDELGWEAATTGLTPTEGFEFRQFTGSGLLVIGDYAFRRFDQSLQQVASE